MRKLGTIAFFWLVGCGGAGGRPADLGVVDALPLDAPREFPPADAGPPPNIGEWCDPRDNAGPQDPTNPACIGVAQCLAFDDPPTIGMCVVYGCEVDLLRTSGANEESCRLDYPKSNSFCVDIDGIAGDDGEINQLQEQNTDLGDNVCVPKCVPKDSGNDCAPEFACNPANTRFNFTLFADTIDDSVCLGLACQSGEDCRVAVTREDFCTESGGECPAGQTCQLRTDLDDDNQLDHGACTVAGVCNTANGLCGKHELGDPAAEFGDPCEYDTQCPNGGTCLAENEVRDELNRVVGYAPRNGYCTMFGCRFDNTLTEFACPAGYACAQNYFAGACFKNCDPEDATGTDCRGNACDPANGITTGCDWFGDFECYDLTGWGYSLAPGVPGLRFVDGNPIICELRGQSCEPACPTGYACTDPETGLSSDIGLCLDATTSGPPCATLGVDGAFCEGSCVDRDSDVENCGFCGNACEGGTPNCVGGTCVP